MKTVKTKDDLQRLALQRGASASFSGSKFNSTADKVDAVKQPPPAPQPFPVPLPEPTQAPDPVIEVGVAAEPAKPVDATPGFQAAVDAIQGHAAASLEVQKSNAQVMAGLKDVMTKLSEQNSSTTPDVPQKKWSITPIRDERGILKSLDVVQS